MSRISDFDSIGAAYQRFYTRVGCGQRSAIPDAGRPHTGPYARSTACQNTRYITLHNANNCSHTGKNSVQEAELVSHKYAHRITIWSLHRQHNFSNNLRSDRIESETLCYLVAGVSQTGNQLSYPDS